MTEICGQAGHGAIICLAVTLPGTDFGRAGLEPMTEDARQTTELPIRTPPAGLAILALVGPSFVWAAEYIGSGEVILATRTGAILGTSVLWVVVLAVFLKFWIGVSGARYTVCTGEGMIDMFDRMPGPRHWVVWLVMVIQLVCAILAMGTLATSAGVFLHSLIPAIDQKIWGWFAAIFAVAVVWSGVFGVLKMVMSVLILMIILGAVYLAVRVFPGFAETLSGLSLGLPQVPQWARAIQGVSSDPWDEILPVFGWGAGGFASQVWYTYWVIGAGYGATVGRGCGKPADVAALKNMSHEAAERIKGWCHVLYADSTLAMIIGVIVTGGFLVAGAGILGAAKMVPSNEDMAEVLSKLFSSRWDRVGGFLFKLSGAAAMVSTLVGQLAGWPRLLADSFRICIPGFNTRFAWKTQFRMFLIFFFCTSMMVVFVLGLKPVFLLKLSSMLEGVLLIALQAICVGIGLFVVMPKLLSKDALRVLRPSPVFAVGLVVAGVVFGYLCLIQVPPAVGDLLSQGP